MFPVLSVYLASVRCLRRSRTSVAGGAHFFTLAITSALYHVF